jgi:adenosylcobinamide-phosphate synthase
VTARSLIVPAEARLVHSTIFASAVLLDALLGDPEWWPHPVRAIGWAANQLETLLRPRRGGRTAELLAGAMLTGSIVAGSMAAAKALLRLGKPSKRSFGFAFEICLAASCIALRSLTDEARKTIEALESGDLVRARKQLARIVGRDTENLGASEISRAVIETLAESLSDGVVAPMLYLVLGGVPLAMGYKAINTLDSMIGHRDERYLYFGRAAARLDDAANLLPSRLTAMLITAAAVGAPKASAASAWKTWLADGARHASPNAGQTEAAMAGALMVRLGGTNTYDGEPVASPVMGSAYRAPVSSDARRAIRLTAAAGYLSGGLLWIWLRRQEAK